MPQRRGFPLFVTAPDGLASAILVDRRPWRLSVLEPEHAKEHPRCTRHPDRTHGCDQPGASA